MNFHSGPAVPSFLRVSLYNLNTLPNNLTLSLFPNSYNDKRNPKVIKGASLWYFYIKKSILQHFRLL